MVSAQSQIGVHVWMEGVDLAWLTGVGEDRVSGRSRDGKGFRLVYRLFDAASQFVQAVPIRNLILA